MNITVTIAGKRLCLPRILADAAGWREGDMLTVIRDTTTPTSLRLVNDHAEVRRLRSLVNVSGTRTRTCGTVNGSWPVRPVPRPKLSPSAERAMRQFNKRFHLVPRPDGGTPIVMRKPKPQPRGTSRSR